MATFFIAFCLMLMVSLLLLVVGIYFLARRIPLWWRIPVVVASATLLLTPSLAPAGIVAVPIPIGVLLAIALFTGTWGEFLGWIGLFPMWQAIAFSGTALVSYAIARRILSNHGLKPSVPPTLNSGKPAA
jgi:hypothetical protein